LFRSTTGTTGRRPRSSGPTGAGPTRPPPTSKRSPSTAAGPRSRPCSSGSSPASSPSPSPSRRATPTGGPAPTAPCGSGPHGRREARVEGTGRMEGVERAHVLPLRPPHPLLSLRPLPVEPLDFPAYDLPVLDPVRRRWVRLTPEERVRQLLLRLLADLGHPTGLTAVEKGFDYLGAVWRADVVVHDRRGRPLLMAECKAPDVPVTQATFDQLARYNAVVGARALLATNGRVHYCCARDADGAYRFLDAIPTFDALVAGP